MLKFGSGVLVATNTTANSTPIQFGQLQDVEFGSDVTRKDLFGQYQVAMESAPGEKKITGKAKVANINGLLYNDLFWGGTMASGQILAVNNEAASIPAATSYTVTVSNASNFDADYGVAYASNGVAFTRVASGSEAAGSYSVDTSTGIYTFAAADASTNVFISYSYTATTGQTITIKNQLQGVDVEFGVQFNTTYKNKQAYYTFSRCVSSKLNVASKMADWNIDELDFQVLSNPDLSIGKISLAE